MSDPKPIKIKISGRIDERSKFPQVQKPPAAITLDLQGVTLINSAGVKKWVEWTRSLPSVPIALVNAPPVIVDQVNMVFDFLPKGAKVMSFFVPYYSEESEETHYTLYKAGEDYQLGSEEVTPKKVSGPNGEELEMDVIASKYFSFLKKM